MSSVVHTLRATLGVATLASLALPALATNGYFSHAYGTRSEAVAGASVAWSQDALAIASNPAGLASVDDGLVVGATLFRPDRGASLRQGGLETEFSGNGTDAFIIPSFGVSRHLNGRWTVGIAAFGNGGMNTNYETNPFARFGAQGSAGVDLSQAFVSPAVAWRAGDATTLGLAVNLAYQEFRAKGLGPFAGFSSSPGNVSNRGKDTSTGAGFRLGWQQQLGEALTFGASWQSKTNMGRFDKYAGLFADAGGFDIPSTWSLGLGWKATDALHLAVEWQRIAYSEVASVGNSVASLFAGKPLGAADGPGFGWRDISVVKLGAAWQVSPAWTLRGGLSRSGQPIPSGETFFNILAPGVVRTHATLGAGLRLGDGNELSFSLLHAFREDVRGAGSLPTAFGGGEANVHLAESSVGLSWSHRFE